MKNSLGLGCPDMPSRDRGYPGVPVAGVVQGGCKSALPNPTQLGRAQKGPSTASLKAAEIENTHTRLGCSEVRGVHRREKRKREVEVFPILCPAPLLGRQCSSHHYSEGCVERGKREQEQR